jgi:hypothetical protein
VPTTRASSAARAARALPGISLVRIIGEPATLNEAATLAGEDKNGKFRDMLARLAIFIV